MKLEEKLVNRFQAILEEFDQEIKITSWDLPEPNRRGEYPKEMVFMEFAADYASEIGFCDRYAEDYGLGFYFNISLHEEDIALGKEEGLDAATAFQEEVAGKFKWEIFKRLEDAIMALVQETANNDPCSFRYEYDTNHMGGNGSLEDSWVEFRVYAIDELS